MSTRRNFAFAASVLPAGFLRERAEALDVGRLFVLSEVHERSYGYVAQRVPGLRVSRLRGGLIGRQLAVLWLVARARLTNREVIFFHECCWPLFDLAVSWFKPRGRFFPQITMAAYEAIASADWPMPSGTLLRWRRRLFTPFMHRFVVFRSQRLSGASGYDYFLSLREYPPSIVVSPPAAYRPAPPAYDGVRRVIFLTGIESVADDELRSFYEQLIEMAHAAGNEVFVKDHPLFRLNVSSAHATVLDAAMPIELIEQSFSISIGIATTALVSVGERKLSVVQLLNAMTPDAKASRMRHLQSLPGGAAVEFPTSLEAIREVLKDGGR